MVHNSYQQRGGEDTVVAAEARLLEAKGHAVVLYQRHNDELRNRGLLGDLVSGVETVWSFESNRALKNILIHEKPDVAHFHNTFPLISPSAYYTCAEAEVPVVQTLHNYRLLCPVATFLRNGKVCEACLGRSVPWPGAVHGCYRGSRLATAAVSAMMATHRAMRTWQTKVNVYIALSEFARQKFIDGGLPGERIVVKPNFVHPDPGKKKQTGDYALFVGRLSEEKGLRVLLEAWSRLSEPIPLRVVGDGPMRDEIASEIKRKGLKGTQLLGCVPPSEIIALMHGARFLVLPSLWLETFAMVIAEAFACGLPVIASRLGAMEELIEHGRTGLHFTAGDDTDLCAKVKWAWTHGHEISLFGREARSQFEQKYTAEQHYDALKSIYRAVTRGRERSPAVSVVTYSAVQGQSAKGTEGK